MEQFRKLPPDDFPLLRGVEDKCEKNRFMKFTEPISGYSFGIGSFEHIQERSL